MSEDRAKLFDEQRKEIEGQVCEICGCAKNLIIGAESLIWICPMGDHENKIYSSNLIYKPEQISENLRRSKKKKHLKERKEFFRLMNI
jgi:hypothetical protein